MALKSGFKPSPITPKHDDYLIFEGVSVDEQGKQHYLDVHIAYRQACLNAIEYLTKFGYSRAQAYAILGCAPAGTYQRGGGYSQRMRHVMAANGNFRLRCQSDSGGAEQESLCFDGCPLSPDKE